MSADNGFMIRKNKDQKFVLQQYFASSEDFPSINDPRAQVFDTLEEAALAYAEIEKVQIVEYGLQLRIDVITNA